MQGEKIVAAETLSRLNDKFFGQWLMLNVPFNEPSDFYSHCADQLKLVPEQHENFAMALLCTHPIAVAMWHDDEATPERHEDGGHDSQSSSDRHGHGPKHQDLDRQVSD